MTLKFDWWGGGPFWGTSRPIHKTSLQLVCKVHLKLLIQQQFVVLATMSSTLWPKGFNNDRLLGAIQWTIPVSKYLYKNMWRLNGLKMKIKYNRKQSIWAFYMTNYFTCWYITIEAHSTIDITLTDISGIIILPSQTVCSISTWGVSTFCKG